MSEAVVNRLLVNFTIALVYLNAIITQGLAKASLLMLAFSLYTVAIALYLKEGK